ncbi:MAG TPA: hypothetical protein PLU71_02505 [Candidatus Dependentiae bacterium]|nr:hypothetical protein [Candidatus Dependentiae bacterium]HRQ62701.1 hypothetical protein [Candidatus Dependentiae bacterium]
MKTHSVKHSILMLSFLLLSSINVLYADEVWVGTSTPSVENENLLLDNSSGDIVFNNNFDCEVFIQATTTDVNVTMNGPIVIRPGDQQAQITILGSSGRKVIFFVDNDLRFEGSKDVAQDKLLIYIEPQGSDFTVEFRIKGGNTVSFTSDVDSGPTEVWLELDDTPGGTLAFLRDTTESVGEQDLNVGITVGKNSVLSYIDNEAFPDPDGGFGRIQFNPSNATNRAGRMVLTVEDSGAVIISPRTFIEVSCGGGIYENILVDRTILGAGLATFEVVNTAGQAGLQIINENATFPALLVDPFCNEFTRTDTVNYNGTFPGVQWGFILGANGQMNIGDDAFVDYIGTQTDMCPTVTAIPNQDADCDSACDCDCSCGVGVDGLLKARNGSALIIDGSNFPNALPAAMNFGINSGLYLRSGVNCLGFVEDYEGIPFAIDPLSESCGAGLVVFDIEGQLNVTGSNSGSQLRSKIEILSLMVNPFGGPLFWNGTQTIFPIRTFATDTNGELIQYNKAAMLVNNRLNLANMALDHTDQIHNVYENNSVQSEPTYIGGETFTLKTDVARPKIAFNNSYFLVHTNVGVTGVDLLVPNSHASFDPDTDCIDNESHFTFFYNGKRVDSGTGRFMILGTQPGSFACNGCSIISRDAHLDVIQDTNCSNSDADTLDHLLLLDVSANNTLVNNQINPAENINGQYSIQTIFLGFASNISIGTQANSTGFDFDTLPQLSISGNYFSLDTQGGLAGRPEYSGVTGEGGIFVDLNGTIDITNGYQASIGAMVTKSLNGIVNLPKNQVLFEPGIGISNWNLNSDSIIIPAGQCLSDYTLYWIAVVKDYDIFCPYLVDNVNSCTCPAVTQENVNGMPVIAGTVQQLQIKDSRLGDPANIKIVSGGIVEELVFLLSNKSAVAPTAVVIVEDDGVVGLGSAHRNVDSLCASFVLGVNGVTIIANGDGKVVLNEDMIINNVCSILRGPDFNTGADEGILHITSDRTHNIYVTSTGTLDLRSFQSGDRVQIEGNVQVILESGARVLMDGVELVFADEACMLTQKYDLIFSAFEDATSLASTDDFRVSLIGTGTISLTDCSCFFVQEDSFVGVETLFEFNGTDTCEIPTTDLTISVGDSAQFIIGTDCEEEAGAFQVGNTEDHDGHAVRFNLTMAGSDAIFRIRKGGFFGLATGIVQKNAGSVPNSWEIDTTFNVESVTINVLAGLFAHDRIYSGDDVEAALMAIGDDSNTVFSFLYGSADTEQEFRALNEAVHGGGNIVRITPGVPVNPVVLDTDNTSGRVRTGILASRPLLADTPEAVSVSGDDLFSAIKTLDMQAVNRSTDKANFAIGVQAFRDGHTGIRTGYILGDIIVRFDAFDFFGPGTQESKRQRAIDLGAGYIRVANTSTPEESTFASVIPA